MRKRRRPWPSAPLVALNTQTCRITERDSARKTPPITSRGQRLLLSRATAARQAPMAREPVSPMNTLAGWRFCTRNPSQAPAMAAQKPARAGSPSWPRSINCSPRPVNTTAPQPAARPSRPSVRLVALLSARNTNRPRGQISRPRGNTQPRGRAKSLPSCCCQAAQARKAAAVRPCSSSLPRGERPLLVRRVRLRQSSMPPIAR